MDVGTTGGLLPTVVLGGRKACRITTTGLLRFATAAFATDALAKMTTTAVQVRLRQRRVPVRLRCQDMPEALSKSPDASRAASKG